MWRKRGGDAVWKNCTNRRECSVGPAWGLSSCLVLLAHPHPPPRRLLVDSEDYPRMHLSLLSGLSGSRINQHAVLFKSVTLSAQLCRSVTPHRDHDSSDYWFLGQAIIHPSLLHFLTASLFLAFSITSSLVTSHLSCFLICLIAITSCICRCIKLIILMTRSTVDMSSYPLFIKRLQTTIAVVVSHEVGALIQWFPVWVTLSCWTNPERKKRQIHLDVT